METRWEHGKGWNVYFSVVTWITVQSYLSGTLLIFWVWGKTYAGKESTGGQFSTWTNSHKKCIISALSLPTINENRTVTGFKLLKFFNYAQSFFLKFFPSCYIFKNQPVAAVVVCLSYNVAIQPDLRIKQKRWSSFICYSDMQEININYNLPSTI